MEPPLRPERRPPVHRSTLSGLALAAFVVLLALAACTQPAGSGGSQAPSASPVPSTIAATVHGTATAGPTCPVEPASPMPGECAPRAVGGAVLVITDAAGHEVARLTTGADGGFSVTLAAGSYTLTPQPVEGLMTVAPPVTFSVSATSPTQDLRVEYDTGIR
jgi:hypothetical protein